MQVQKSIFTPEEPGIDLVGIISEGTYTSFPQALKEFVSNSYDACASRVDITISEDCQNVEIVDNGIGMDSEEFKNFFASIARCHTSGSNPCKGLLRRGRPKIGKFGIGALAVASVAKKFIIRSSKLGKKSGFQAEIDLTEVRKHFGHNEGLSKLWKFQGQEWTESPEQHYTKIQVIGLRSDISNILQFPGERKPSEFYDSVERLSGMEQLRWKLGLICGVCYENGFPISKDYLDSRHDAVVIRQSNALNTNEFSIFLNGVQILRSITLPKYHIKKLKREEDKSKLFKRSLGFDMRCFCSKHGSPVEYEGYVVSQAMQVFPKELRGILVRIRGVAVGWHRSLYVPENLSATFRDGMSGEIWVNKGLDEALQFDRESFHEDHPLFRQFCDDVGGILLEEGVKFRQRSARRNEPSEESRGEEGEEQEKEEEQKQETGTETGTVADEVATPAEATRADEEDQLVPTETFKNSPAYIKNTMIQINGCWNHGYYDGCAVLIRKVLQCLIIDLYDARGWRKELYDTNVRQYIGLQRIIGKLKADGRFSTDIDTNVARGLDELKEMGDIAAHEYRIRVNKNDLRHKRDDLRYTCERLIFLINQYKPTSH